MREAVAVLLKAVSKTSGLSSRTLAQSLLTICCGIHLHGCVAVPVPVALPDPEPFTADRMAPIRIGQTTRDEVRALFANWNYQTDDGDQTAHLEPQVAEGGRYWVFNQRRQTGDIAWAGLAVVPEAPVPIPFFAGKTDNYEDFWALFEFNDAGTVTRFWIASDKTPCAVGGVCYHGGYLQIIADATTSANAHGSTLTSDRCALYVYAEDGFEFPVAVTDGIDTKWLFGQTSFVRFDLARRAASASAWYENMPGSAVPMPILCTGGESHYMALRPNKGLIEVKQETSSAGAGAVKERYLVEHLVLAHASVAARHPDKIWTNCTAVAPCRELAILDTRDNFGDDGIRLSMTVNAEEQFRETRGHESHLLLRPGLYTLSSTAHSREYYAAVKRVDTFELQAGHRYQTERMSVDCGNPWFAPISKEVQAQVCNERLRQGNNSVSTNWFEDVATKRVVAGQKWCASDSECPDSLCSKQDGQPRGICSIPELECTYDKSCKPQSR